MIGSFANGRFFGSDQPGSPTGRGSVSPCFPWETWISQTVASAFAGAECRDGPPKTGKSKRDVIIDERLAAVLRARMSNRDEVPARRRHFGIDSGCEHRLAEDPGSRPPGRTLSTSRQSCRHAGRAENDRGRHPSTTGLIVSGVLPRTPRTPSVWELRRRRARVIELIVNLRVRQFDSDPEMPTPLVSPRRAKPDRHEVRCGGLCGAGTVHLNGLGDAKLRDADGPRGRA